MQWRTMLLWVTLRMLLEVKGFEYKEFSSQPGIYLEEVGRTFLASDDWKIVLYYNLENYWHEWDTLGFLVTRLSTACHFQSTGQYNNTTTVSGDCDTMLESIQFMMAGIEDRNTMLKVPVRVKRAPLEFVGTFLNEAFGVLDQRTAVQYEKQISELQTGAIHMKQLIQQQTHVLEVTTNLVRKQQEQIQKQYHQVQAAIRAITDHAKFIDMALQLFVHITLFKETQEAMIDVIVDLHQGHLNTKLLTPDQLRDQLKQMKSWVPADVQVPDYQQHWVQLYQLLRVKARLVNNYLIFELRVPLFGSEDYQIYRSHSVPTVVQDKMVYIQPMSEVILINLKRTLYYQMAVKDLQDCQKWDQSRWICPLRGPLYIVQEGHKPCELQLLQREERAVEQCQLRTTKMRTYIQPLTQANTWVVSVAQAEFMDIICNNTVQHVSLQGSGLLSLEPGCLLKSNQYLLQSSTTYTTQQPVWFLPSFNLSQHAIQSVNLETINLEPEILEMVQAVQTLHQEETWSQLSIHDIQQYVVSGVLFIPVVLLVFAWWRRRQLAQLIYDLTNNKPINISNKQPTPRIRRQSWHA